MDVWREIFQMVKNVAHGPSNLRCFAEVVRESATQFAENAGDQHGNANPPKLAVETGVSSLLRDCACLLFAGFCSKQRLQSFTGVM